MSNILVVDDDIAVNEVLVKLITKLGYVAFSAHTFLEGIAKAARTDMDLILLDIKLPDGSGLDALPEFRESDSKPEVIIITGYGDPDGAELAIKNGAWDYMLKPASCESITLTIKRALMYRAEKTSKKLPLILKRDDIIGSSSNMNLALERIAQASGTLVNVLITGETGTGKELFARAIHKNSILANKRFVVVDCAALPDSLVESTLFGHAKGAFTNADKERDGLIKQADGGTLFLDEVGELPLSAQKAFLRVIQERCFRPVGGKKEIEVSFRLIAATNRDLSEMVKTGQFRNDLLYRLHSFGIEMPTLEDRKQDIKELAIYYTNKLCEIYATETKGFSSEFFKALETYPWPGNVRELFNTLEEVLSVTGQEPVLYPYHLPIRIRAAVARLAVTAKTNNVKKFLADSGVDDFNKENFLKIKVYKDIMEREYLEKLTRLTKANRKEACRISGLSRTRLFELLKKHNMSRWLRKKSDSGGPSGGRP